MQKPFQDVLIDEAEYDGIPSWLTARGYFSGKISNYFQQLYTKHRAEFSSVLRGIALRFSLGSLGPGFSSVPEGDEYLNR